MIADDIKITINLHQTTPGGTCINKKGTVTYYQIKKKCLGKGRMMSLLRSMIFQGSYSTMEAIILSNNVSVSGSYVLSQAVSLIRVFWWSRNGNGRIPLPTREE